MGSLLDSLLRLLSSLWTQSHDWLLYSLTFADFVAEGMIGLGLLAIPLGLAILLYRRPSFPFRRLAWQAMLVGLLAAAVAFASAAGSFLPTAGAETWLKLALALALLWTTLAARPTFHHLIALPRRADLTQRIVEQQAEIRRRVVGEARVRLAQQDAEEKLAEVAAALCTAHDTLKTKQVRLAFAFDEAADGLWDWQITTSDVYYSPRWAQMLGYGSAEFEEVAVTRWALVHPDDRPRAIKAFTDHAEERTPAYECDYRALTKQGHVLWLKDRGKVVERGEDGRPLRAVGTATDVTRLVTAEQALRASNARVRRLYDQTPAMLHSVDAEGWIVSVSDHWLERLGYARDEVLGRRSTDFMAQKSRQFMIDSALPTFRARGAIRNVACQMVKKNGELVDVQLSATAEYDDTGRRERCLTVLTDVTERNQALRQLLESEARLRLALEGAREGMWDWNIETGHLFLSRKRCSTATFTMLC
jgi:PAS domain S-box-containing protein